MDKVNKMDRKCILFRREKGPRVLLVPQAGVGTVYVEMVVNCGSFMDPEKELEVSHLLEHMQGNFTSVRYPDAKKIREKFERYGCKMNALTYTGQTKYYVICLKKYFPKVFSIFLESFTHFHLDKSEFSSEKASVITEIKQNEVEDIWESFYTTIQKQLYGPNIPAAWVTPEERIKSTKKLQIKDVLSFRKKYYENPELYTLTVAGDFPTSDTLLVIRQKFVKLITKVKVVPSTDLVPIIPTFPLAMTEKRKEVYVKNTKTGSNHYKIRMIWGIGNTITPSDPKKCAAVNILCLTLASGMSSRLYELLRIKEKMVYSVQCDFNPDYYGSGLFLIRTETPKKNLKRLVGLVERELKKLAKEKMSSVELEGVKNIAMMTFYQESQDISPEKFADFYSYQISFDKPLRTYAEQKKAYEKTTADDVLQVCKDILNCNQLIIYSG